MNLVPKECRMPSLKLIVLSGATGSGKSTLRSILEKEFAPRELYTLHNLTTREKRLDDEPNLECIPREWFDLMVGNKPGFLWVAEAHGHRYGVLQRHFEKALEQARCTVATITPGHLKKMETAALATGRCKKEDILFIHILSPGDDVLLHRLTTTRDMSVEAAQRRIADCTGWDEEAKKQGVNVFFIRNEGTIEDLQREAQKVLEKGQ